MTTLPNNNTAIELESMRKITIPWVASEEHNLRDFAATGLKTLEVGNVMKRGSSSIGAKARRLGKALTPTAPFIWSVEDTALSQQAVDAGESREQLGISMATCDMGKDQDQSVYFDWDSLERTSQLSLNNLRTNRPPSQWLAAGQPVLSATISRCGDRMLARTAGMPNDTTFEYIIFESIQSPQENLSEPLFINNHRHISLVKKKNRDFQALRLP